MIHLRLPQNKLFFFEMYNVLHVISHTCTVLKIVCCVLIYNTKCAEMLVSSCMPLIKHSLWNFTMHATMKPNIYVNNCIHACLYVVHLYVRL